MGKGVHRRISQELDKTIREFQKIFKERLDKDISLVKASEILNEAMLELDLENIYLRRQGKRRIRKKRDEKLAFELKFRY